MLIQELEGKLEKANYEYKLLVKKSDDIETLSIKVGGRAVPPCALLLPLPRLLLLLSSLLTTPLCSTHLLG